MNRRPYPPSQAPAYVRVAEAIEREIVEGHIALGDHVGTEATLGQRFNVNRSTIREGIRLLEQSGMLRRDSSRRLFASLPHDHSLSTRVSRALVLHETTFRELWEASMSLETAVAEAAARQASAEDILDLRDNLARNRECAGNIEAEIALDSEFHNLVARISRNRVLQMAREPAAMLFAPSLRVILNQSETAAERNRAAHEQITRALTNNDPEQARLWMHRHMVDWREGFERAGRLLDEPLERSLISHQSTIHNPRGNTR